MIRVKDEEELTEVHESDIDEPDPPEITQQIFKLD